MEKEKISIIIPVYNREKCIGHCLNSVLKQDYINLEIIIINDGSTDATLDLLESFQTKDSRIVIYTVPNGGASKARNYGLTKATSDYICYIDSDDYIEKDYITTLFNAIKTYNTDMSQYSHFIKTKEYKYLNKKSNNKIRIVYQDDLFNEFFRVNGEPDMHTLWNKMYKREILSEFKLEEGRMNEDVLGCFDIIHMVEKCAIIQTGKYYYFQNNNGVTKSVFQKRDLDLLYMWDRVIEKTRCLHPNYYSYAVLNRKRANFTLLAKMLISGYNKRDDSLRYIKKELKNTLKYDFTELIRWKMPLNRKILLIYIRYIF